MTRVLVVLAVLVLGCATPPQSHIFKKTWTVPGTFEETWSATVQLFAEKGWPIATLEKASGIIVSDWVSIGTQSPYADCGTPGIATIQRREAKFNVFIRKGDSGPSLTVNANFRELRVFDSQSFYQDCTSTGALESELHALILQRTR